jgi:hypothetical protein
MEGKMKKIILSTFIFFVASFNTFSQEMSKDTFLKIMSSLGATQYWSKGPASLMFYCTKTYPDTSQVVQRDYLNWKKKDAAFNIRIDKIQDFFAPEMAKISKKTVDQWNVHLTKMIDDQVTEKFILAADDSKRHSLCGDFSTLLSNMFAEDLIKPRVIMATEELEGLKAGALKNTK